MGSRDKVISADRRPALDTLKVEQSRGMKVRSSVKKLCDGCKVRTHILSIR